MSDSSFLIARPRVYLGESLSIGPGKIALLRKIDETHSITAAAKALGIPYKRAWSLIETLNQGLGRPVVQTLTGGKGGGGTRVTELGRHLMLRYDALETRINETARTELQAFNDRLD